MTDFRGLLRALAEGGVEFILVGGVAATIHGTLASHRIVDAVYRRTDDSRGRSPPRVPPDVDAVYRRTDDSVRRLVEALDPLHPYLRGAPRGLPFLFDAGTVRAGLNFALSTDIGEIDPLGEVAGGGRWEDLDGHAVTVRVFDLAVRCVDLPTLIHPKRAAGHPKDLEAIGEVERLLEAADDD